MADVSASNGLLVNRWQRYGHDRLYVSAPDGTRIGWLDLRNDTHEIAVSERAPEFWAAVADFRGAPAALPAPRVAMVGDLATNRPGEALAARAAEIRAERPVRWRLRRLFGLRTDDRSWHLGGVAERRVGRLLDRLARRPGWYVLHGIVIGRRGRDVDHLVVGPSGVYCVNTKHHRGLEVSVGREVVFVAGQRRPHAGKAREEAHLVSRALTAAAGFPVHVTPVVAIFGARRVTGWRTGRPQQVKVLPAKALRRWLRWRRRTIDAETVERLYELARRPETWRV